MSSNPGVGSTRVKRSVTYAQKLDDRIRQITVRLNRPYNEVIIDLLIAGLDSTQDLALREPEPRT